MQGMEKKVWKVLNEGIQMLLAQSGIQTLLG